MANNVLEEWSRARVVDVPDDEIQRMRRAVEVRPSPHGGRGLFALRRLKQDTFVGTYPGAVLSEDLYERLVARFPEYDTYAVQFWMPTATRQLDRDWVINPGDPRSTGLLRRWKSAFTPYVNEPPPGKEPNLFWVWNLALHRVEMYTSKTVQAGQELFICYGHTYERKGYTTACSSLPPNRIMALHFKRTPQGQTEYLRNPTAVRSQTPPATEKRKRTNNRYNHNSWLAEMHSLLDKPVIAGRDIQRIRMLVKIYLARNQ